MRRRVGARFGVLLLGLVLVLALAACLGSSTSRHAGAAPGQSASSASTGPRDGRPNIVLVLMDDASYDLLHTMAQARRMQAEGATYVNSHVVDSLCCPSRAAILTGRPPHLTGVLTNTPGSGRTPLGGYEAFAAHHDETSTFNLALQRSGYTTAFIGKYLNGYEPGHANGTRTLPPSIPGWNTFDAVFGGGYHEWGFLQTRTSSTGALRLVRNPKPPRSSPVEVLDRHYATNVMAGDAVSFLDAHRHDSRPYFLEVATYAPHPQLQHAYPDNPEFPSAFADRAPPNDPRGGFCAAVVCGALRLSDLAGYADPRADNRPTYLLRNGATRPAPPWNRLPVTLTARNALQQYRDRARMVQSVDRMVGRIRAAVGPDTYVVLTSDNGYHLGQLQLNGGKGTPYDFDTKVPLVVVGPGVRPGVRRQFVSNIDLAPTFEQLAGLRRPASVAGTSFAPSLRRRTARGDHFVFYDHTQAPVRPGEVDQDIASGGRIDVIPSYVGVRGPQGLLVRLDLDSSAAGHRYAWELYRYQVPFERTNVFARDHSQPWARELMRRLRLWVGCQPVRCRAAAR